MYSIDQTTWQRKVKRLKAERKRDYNLLPIFQVPKGGYRIEEESSKVEKGIVFYVPKEEEYFNPKKRTLLYDPLEVYKAGLVTDRVHNVKRLKEPLRWCVLPKSETVTVEVPLTEWKHTSYKKEVVQELGHVAWHKAYYHVDNRIFEESTTNITVKQVVKKLNDKSLPRWKPRNRAWDEEFFGAVEVPGTVFCTEQKLIKQLKYVRGEKPEVVHQTEIAHTVGDNIGCSIFRRNQPPVWQRFVQTEEDQVADTIWNNQTDRKQWIYSSLYNIWTGEESVPDRDWRERVYWTGPARHFDRNKYLQCHYPPHCVDIVEVEEEEEEPLAEAVIGENEEAW